MDARRRWCIGHIYWVVSHPKECNVTHFCFGDAMPSKFDDGEVALADGPLNVVETDPDGCLLSLGSHRNYHPYRGDMRDENSLVSDLLGPSSRPRAPLPERFPSLNGESTPALNLDLSSPTAALLLPLPLSHNHDAANTTPPNLPHPAPSPTRNFPHNTTLSSLSLP